MIDPRATNLAHVSETSRPLVLEVWEGNAITFFKCHNQ